MALHDMLLNVVEPDVPATVEHDTLDGAEGTILVVNSIEFQQTIQRDFQQSF